MFVKQLKHFFERHFFMRQLMMAILMTGCLFSVSMANLKDGLISYWSLSGNGNDIVGSTDLSVNNSATFAQGKVGNGAVMTGTGQSLGGSDYSAMKITGAMSFSCWFKLRVGTVTPSFLILANKWNAAGGRSYQIYLSNLFNGKYYVSAWINNSTCVDALNTNGFTFGTDWHHVVFVFIPSTSMTLYIDGVQKGQNTSAIPSSITDGTAPFFIGNDDAGNDYLDGTIDEVSVHNRALSETEATQLYNFDDVGQTIGMVYLTDINSDGYPEVANLVIENVALGPLAKIYDGSTNDILNSVYFFNSEWNPKGISASDVNNDGFQEISVWATKGDSTKVESRKISDGTFVKTTILH
jgi:hypothetical protein